MIKKPKNIIGVMEVVANTLEQTCGGCPTVYEWKDTDGDSYYFRLRWGSWYIYNETTDETIVDGYTDDGADGVCDWGDVKRYALKKGLIIKEVDEDGNSAHYDEW